MTNERKADALLEAARNWQNRLVYQSCFTLNPQVWSLLRTADDWCEYEWDETTERAASACLSEVCHGLGFEIEDAP